MSNNNDQMLSKRIFGLAVYLSFLNRMKRLKEDGKLKEGKMSQRQYTYWRKQFLNSSGIIIDNALSRAKNRLGIIKPTTPLRKNNKVLRETIKVIENDIKDTRIFLQTTREVGRPPKSRGLINSVRPIPVKRAGRTRHIKPDDERAWVHMGLGLAVCLYAEKYFPNLSTEQEITEKLTSNRHWLHELKSKGCISDALKLPEIKPFKPPSPNHRALCQRFYRALKDYPLPAALL